jgi:Mg-chelatase subunit ChlD
MALKIMKNKPNSTPRYKVVKTEQPVKTAKTLHQTNHKNSMIIKNPNTANLEDETSNINKETGANVSFEFSKEKGNAITLLIIDESGSMGPLLNATIESYNGVVQSIMTDARELPDLVQHMNVWTFEGRTIRENLPLTTVTTGAHIQSLDYRPGGSTPLFDCMGESMSKLERLIDEAKLGDEGTQVSVAIFTDGEENSSRRYGLGEIKRMIERLKLKGWDFSYYGTDHAVEDMAEKLKMDRVERFEKSREGMHMSMMNFNVSARSSKEDYIKRFKQKWVADDTK